MTPYELDSMLRAFTEHELLYQRGIDPYQIIPYHFTDQASGIPRSPGISTTRSAEADADANGRPAELIFVKKRSRFREYPLHQQDRVELAYIYDGVSREVIGDTTIELKKGQTLIVDSDTVHTTLPLGANDIRIVIQFEKRFFDSSFLTRLDKGSALSTFIVNSIAKGTAHDGYIVFASQSSRRLPLFISEFLCEWYEPSSQSAEMLSCLLALIAAELACVHEDDIRGERSLHMSPVLDVLRYIERNYRTCTLEAASDVFDRTPDALSRMLKRETGLSFNQLVRKQRITMAKTLLASSNLPVTGVAKQVGYENMTYFYRIFTQAIGMSPAAYRKQAGGAAKL